MGTVNLGHVKGADGQGVPAGGGTGSFLRKLSAADWDTEWKDVLPIPNGGTGGTTPSEACAALGALPTAGGTMTGPLVLSADGAVCEMIIKPGGSGVTSYGMLRALAEGAAYVQAWNDDTGNNRRYIEISNSARTEGLDYAFKVGDIVNGLNTGYRLYHAGMSTPIPVTKGGTGAITADAALAALGGMPKAGGTFTGAVYAAAESLWLNSAGQYFNDSLMTTASGTALAMYSNGKVVKSSSSRRYKDEICYLDESTADDAGADCQTIYQLRPVTYEYKQQRGERQVGLIAEDVAQIDPSLCVRNEAGDVESVKYQDVGILVLRAVQLLQAQVLAMGDRIAALEGGGEV